MESFEELQIRAHQGQWDFDQLLKWYYEEKVKYEKLYQKYMINRFKNIVIKMGPIEDKTGIFIRVPDKLKDIVEYFTKMQEGDKRL